MHVRDKRILEAIEQYLVKHPEAADSVEGIARWWISEMGVEASEEEVTDALEHRPEDSPIDEQHSLSGRVIYRLRGATRAETNETKDA